MLKKQSALWIDDEPKKAKAAGDSTKGRKSDREKREAKEMQMRIDKVGRTSDSS